MIELHEIHCGPIGVKHLVVVIKLADGATWHCPASVVLDSAVAYYEEYGWRDEDDLEEGEKQPMGDELRGLVEVNCDWVQEAKETHWQKLRNIAVHAAGPATEPPGEELWAVEEQGGDIDVLTTLAPDDQYKIRPMCWTDKLPV